MFLTRKDNQIKHMGHRIELGEIEVAAAAGEGVRGVCCLYQKEKKKLVLCYEGTCELSDFAHYLRSKLPTYRVPNRLVAVETLPRTPNGKLDRRALAAQVIE